MPTIADINTKARKIVDADTTSYPAADLLIDVNAAYEEIIGDIICQDGNWEFDDTNYTDFPRGTTTLVAAQHDYTFDVSHLAIESVQVKDANGLWYFLDPISKDEMGEPSEEFEKTDGKPIYYDKDGASVLLYPAPTATECTLTSGLKVHFRRTADIFTAAQVTTGTKKPGFASPFHYLISYKAVLDYAISYKKDRVPLIMSRIKELTEKMLKFYAKRERDVRNIMTTKAINFR